VSKAVAGSWASPGGASRPQRVQARDKIINILLNIGNWKLEAETRDWVIDGFSF
jgi:hypothetical protein